MMIPAFMSDTHTNDFTSALASSIAPGFYITVSIFNSNSLDNSITQARVKISLEHHSNYNRSNFLVSSDTISTILTYSPLMINP